MEKKTAIEKGKTTSDLISRQEAIDAINRLIGDTKNCKVGTVSFQDGIIDGYCRIRSELLALPSADAVPVVRCRDCKYYWKNSKYKSNMEDMEDVAMCLASPSDDAFCSDGERKDDETD